MQRNLKFEIESHKTMDDFPYFDGEVPLSPFPSPLPFPGEVEVEVEGEREGEGEMESTDDVTVSAFLNAMPVTVVRRMLFCAGVFGAHNLQRSRATAMYVRRFPRVTIAEAAAGATRAKRLLVRENRRREAQRKMQRGSTPTPTPAPTPGCDSAYPVAHFVCRLVEARVGKQGYARFLSALLLLRDAGTGTGTQTHPAADAVSAVLGRIDDILFGHPDLVAAVEGLLPPHHPRHRDLGV